MLPPRGGNRQKRWLIQGVKGRVPQVNSNETLPSHADSHWVFQEPRPHHEPHSQPRSFQGNSQRVRPRPRAVAATDAGKLSLPALTFMSPFVFCDMPAIQQPLLRQPQWLRISCKRNVGEAKPPTCTASSPQLDRTSLTTEVFSCGQRMKPPKIPSTNEPCESVHYTETRNAQFHSLY